MGNVRAGQLQEFADFVLGGARSEEVRRMGRQVNAATDEYAKAYAGRFLLELLQNGYDAHPRGSRGGRVHVLLDEDEGEWGTLYVANGGDPFTWENVKRVCELARSSKVVGEGIGNKGVGFRSVLLISEAPEIYSADPDRLADLVDPADPTDLADPADVVDPAGAVDPTRPGGRELDGYCFRFASRSDLEEFLAGEPDAREVAAEFPLLQAPLPLTEVPPVCRELAARGHVTVVRLPLLEGTARTEVRGRLHELARAQVPVMLFLDWGTSRGTCSPRRASSSGRASRSRTGAPSSRSAV
ncbi:sacsin N-terminal ATP-binding-like domain-containing protein [Streptomyces sp. WAC06614]|uniref:sacsin N-terminal ATP-binding-like domain-containing protein n=1 Tax=Streptomyces sp. WAC06614 TaxID=2487416 RepID=UPI0021AE6DC2|nr:hypothetical protein [Streptomyces sp. WAC06614]